MKFPREVSLDDHGTVHVLDNPSDVDRACRALRRTVSVLERIARFDRGQAGDVACETLQDLGVWVKSVRRIEEEETE